MRKTPDPAIVPLQSAMFAAGYSVKEVCARAGVHVTTWSKWASGGVPHTQKLRDMQAAFESLIAENETV